MVKALNSQLMSTNTRPVITTSPTPKVTIGRRRTSYSAWPRCVGAAFWGCSLMLGYLLQMCLVQWQKRSPLQLPHAQRHPDASQTYGRHKVQPVYTQPSGMEGRSHQPE